MRGCEGVKLRRGLPAVEDYERFQRAVENLAVRGAYFYSITLDLYLGHKRPGPRA